MKTRYSELAAYIGLDWADRKHDLCLQVGLDGTRERSVLEHKPKAIPRGLSLPQLKALCLAIDRLEQEIADCCAKLADYKLFAGLPGAGPVRRSLGRFGPRPSTPHHERYFDLDVVTRGSCKS